MQSTTSTASTATVSCHHCGVSAPQKRCSCCKHARYCNQSCQRADWPHHRLYCYPPTESVLDALAARVKSMKWTENSPDLVFVRHDDASADVPESICACAARVIRHSLALEYTLLALYQRVNMIRLVTVRGSVAGDPIAGARIEPFSLSDPGVTSAVKGELQMLRTNGYVPFMLGLDDNPTGESYRFLTCAVIPRALPAYAAALLPHCDHINKGAALMFLNPPGGPRACVMCVEMVAGALGNASKCADPTACSGYYDYRCEK